MRRMKSEDVDRARATPGRAILLFLTDRCPVGCAHCSVDSRADSPTIRDWDLFRDVVSAICNHSADVVGISGGEPFIERRGLIHATSAFAAAEKDIVIYTSGVWARPSGMPAWIRGVISRCSCLVLSTDAFHQATVYEERFIEAARQLAAEEIWVIVQALDLDDTIPRTEELLERAFDGPYGAYAELRPIPPLPYGRAAGLFTQAHRQPGHSFGRCVSLAAPVVRYDGRLTACCNEQVIMGKGPRLLQARARDAEAASAALQSFDDDPRLEAMRSLGAGLLTALPGNAAFSEREYPSICGLCWDMFDDGRKQTGSMLRALPVLTNQGGH